MFLFDKKSHFNLANSFTMVNITTAILAIYFVMQENFVVAVILSWIGGAFDIFDGKIARKYNLSSEFGIQIDSFADFLAFVIVPIFLIYHAVYLNDQIPILIVAVISIYYIISGLRRLIDFNLKSETGSVEKYFIGVPTPLGAILLWILYLGFSYEILPSAYIVYIGITVVGYLLNSKIKVKHP
jgi:CDP-diacylglycerol--serine O-phosphatidyltransferase